MVTTVGFFIFQKEKKMREKKEVRPRQAPRPKKPTNTFDWSEFAKMWGAPYVFRTEVKNFSGGLLNPRTMANLDSLGLGPGKITIRGRAAYRTDSLVAWLKKRYPTDQQERKGAE